jgi:hypothetical protein
LSDRTCSSTPRRLPTCPAISLDAPKFVTIDDEYQSNAVNALTDLLRSHLHHQRNDVATGAVK